MDRAPLPDDEYRQVRLEQGGRCKVCLEPNAERMLTDRDATGRVRGLLCKRCKVVVDAAGGDAVLLHRVQVYVARAGDVGGRFTQPAAPIEPPDDLEASRETLRERMKARRAARK